MNRERRARLRKILKILEGVKDEIFNVRAEEEIAYDSLPEQFQMTDRGEEMQEMIADLECAEDSIGELIRELKEEHLKKILNPHIV